MPEIITKEERDLVLAYIGVMRDNITKTREDIAQHNFGKASERLWSVAKNDDLSRIEHWINCFYIREHSTDDYLGTL